MMDQYKEQYKKETEQIHAPADLIARTKAAVRQEEARIQREQAERPAAQEASAAPQKSSRGTAARRWAYPLSAAAAIIVLASVSLMMRGLGKSASESSAYEMAAGADSGGEESAVESAFDEAAAEEFAAEKEGTAADRETGTAGVAELTDDKETAGAVAEAEDMVTEMETASADAAEAAEPAEETKRAAASDGLSAGEGEIENVMSQKQEAKEMLADTAAPTPEITVEKVWKKPAFVNRKDIESRTYEGMVFQIVEEKDGWAAFVESENGGGYVIRGEAESVETFLEEGYRRLEEMSW